MSAFLALALRASAQDQTVSGNLTVTGNATVSQLIATGGTITGGSSGLTLNSGATFSTSGYLGLGAAPQYRLQVIGSNGQVLVDPDSVSGSTVFQVRGNSGSNSYIYWSEARASRGLLGFAAGSGDLVYRAGAGSMTSGTEALRITSVGNVGIGIAVPTAMFEVGGSASVDGNLKVGGNDALAPADLLISDTNTHGHTWRVGEAIGGTDNGSLQFKDDTAGAIRLTLDPNGNVGIGTVTPAANFDVAGSANVSGNLTVGGTFTAANFGSGSVTGSSSGLALSAGGTNQNITLTPTGTGATVISGNVGIGTSTPGGALHIQKSSGDADLLLQTMDTTGRERLVFRNEVGTTLGLLYTNSGGATDADLATTPSSVVLSSAGSSNGLTLISPNVAGKIIFATGGSAFANERVRIDSAGNVGIGIATPAAKLDVSGVVRNQGVQIANLAGAALLGTDASGNVTSVSPSALTLTNGQVTSALGFTPYSATNPAGYITATGAPVQSVFGRTGAIALAGADVTTALGYTPYNSSNPAGYITSASVPVQSVFGRTGTVTMTSSDVTSALGYTPLGTSAGALTGNLKLMAGTAASAPLTLQSGANLTTPVFGSVEFDGTNVYVTNNSSSPTRKTLAYAATTLSGYGITDPVVLTSSTYADPSWITSLAASKLAGTVAAAAMPGFTGDVTSSAGSLALSLSPTGVAAGTYSKVTVDAKGRVTAGSALASGDVTTALGFTPYNASNPAGYITSAGVPVQSVFGRTGAVTLTSSDVTTALGYAPLNPAGSATGLALNAGGTNQNVTISPSGTGSLQLNGFVGFGTSSPHYKISLGTDDDSKLALFENAGGANMFGFGYRDDGTNMPRTQFFANGTEVMSVALNGNVGIGTTTPGAALEVNGTNVFINPQNASNATLQFKNGGTLKGFVGYISGTGNTYLGEDGNAVQGVNVTSAGNVGIGTTTPGSKLDVAGVVRSQGVQLSNLINAAYLGTDAAGNFVAASTPTLTSSQVTTALGYTPANSAGATFTGAVSATDLTASSGTVTGGATGLTLNAGGTNQNVAITPSGTGNTIIGGNGNVGIGVTNPTYKLDVNGNFRANGIVSYSSSATGLFGGYGAGLDGSTYQQFVTYADATNGLLFEAPQDPLGNKLNIQFNWRGGGAPGLFIAGATGNVGIGTATPVGKLNVVGRSIYSNDNAVALSIADDTTPTKSVHLGFDASLNRGFIQAGNFGTQYLDFLLNPNGGNVGIGTTTPGSKLDVAGNVNASGNVAVGGSLTAASLTINGTSFVPTDFVTKTGNNTISASAFVASGGSLSGGTGGLTLTPGTINGSIILSHNNPDGSPGTGRTEIRDTLAITNTAGIQYLLMGNQNSNGTNHPAILRSGNGNFEFGSGDSWTDQGGNFTSKVTLLDNGNFGVGVVPTYALQTRDVGPGGNNVKFGSGTVRVGGDSDNGAATVLSVAPGVVNFDAPGVAGGRLTITSSGYVGIGAASPTSGLAISTEGSNYADGSYLLVNSTNAGFGGGATLAGIKTTASDGGDYNLLRLQNAAGTKFVVDGSGDVGIGVPTPAAKLDVLGTIRGSSNADFYNTLFVRNGQVGIGNNAPAAGTSLDVRGGALYVDQQAWLNGPVGIGTTTPASGTKLEVNGDTKLDGNLNVGLTALIAGQLTVQSGATVTGQLTAQSGATIAGPLVAQSGATIAGTANLQSAAVAGTSSFGATMTFGPGTNTGGTLNWGTNPTDALNLVAGAGRSLFLASGGATAPASGMTIASSGLIGIGTASPNANLEISTNGEALRLSTASDPTHYFASLSSRYDSTHPFTFAVANNSATATEYLGVYADSGGANLRVAFPNSKVGVGTTSPSADLEVAGTTKLDGTVALASTTASSSPGTGALTVAGGAGIAGNANIGGSATVSGSATINGNTSVAGTMTVGSGATATTISSSGIVTGGSVSAVTITSTAGATVGGSLSVAQAAAFNGAAVFNNTASFAAGMTIGSQLHADGTGLTMNTGTLTLASADDIILSTPNGTERMRVVSTSGYVGIGTNLPDANLTICNSQSGSDPRTLLSLQGPNNNGAQYETRFVKVDEGQGIPLYINTGTNGVFANEVKFGNANSGGAYPSLQTFNNTNLATNGGIVEVGATYQEKYPQVKLGVNGAIHATEVLVDTAVTATDIRVQPKAWADNVFDADHRLAPLSEVEQQIKANKHLPGIPSAAEVAANGVSVADMQTKLLAKIEELTLRQIEQEKRIEKLEAENAALRATTQK